MERNQNLVRMSFTVMRTSRSVSSLKETMCFLMESLTEAFSQRWAISLSALTQTSRMLATG
jgi:hypothetical protein